MSNIRAFFAINVPIRILEQVNVFQTALRDKAARAAVKVAWVPLPNMHITLKFLGDIAEENVSAIRDLLLPKFEQQPPFVVKVKGSGVFPSRNRPRVVWVGIENESGELSLLARALDTWLTDLGFAPDRAFHAHLTLGRVKCSSIDLLEDVPEIQFGTYVVNQVMLYKSVMQRKGADYSPLVRFAFTSSSENTVETEVNDSNASTPADE